MAANNVRLNNTPVVGYSGTVTLISGLTINVKSWAAAWAVPNVDTTLINDGVSYYDPAHVGPFSGSIVGQLPSATNAMISGLMNSDAPTLSSATGAMVLYKETSGPGGSVGTVGNHSLSFTGVLSGVQYSRNNVVGEIVATFVASGPIIET